MTQGASIKYATPYGIRFQAKITSDNEEVISDSNVITEGMLITTKDIFEANDKELNVNSTYNKVDVENNGWYKIIQEHIAHQ